MENSQRETKFLVPGAIHLLDEEGDRLNHFIEFQRGRIDEEALWKLRNEVAPSWLFHVLETKAESPLAYKFLEYDNRCLFRNNMDLKGLCVGNAAGPGYADGAGKVYNNVRSSGVPSVTYELISDDLPRTYIRQAIPLIRKGNVEQILVASRYQEVLGDTDILREERPVTGEKVEYTLSAGHGTIHGIGVSEKLLSMSILKTIDPERDALRDNFRKGIRKDPFCTVFAGNHLPHHGKAPGKA